MPLVKLAAKNTATQSPHCFNLMHEIYQLLYNHADSLSIAILTIQRHGIVWNLKPMPNEKINKRRPYYDTGPIPHESLLKDEQQIVVDICDLLMEIKKSVEDRPVAARDRDNSTDSIWGTAVPKLNNVILLDGERGVGKTSLMLTLINALSNPEEWNKEECNDNYSLPGGIDGSVRVMRQIDFDPLPPDLPIYSWIIQAFHPMVTKVINSNPDMSVNIFEDDSFGEKNDSIAVQHGKLRQTATVGWTTGLLKNQLGKDAAEILMWQQEQQMDWQHLQKLWHKFIDKLLEQLENSDHCDHLPLPRNCLIVLPIDDLDLQVTRTRELLLALRVLRHNRLVYLLTGDAVNTNLALTASFYRDFIDRTSNWNEDVLDKIWENSKKLGPPLRDKTIPSSQIFVIKPVPIKDALEWIPPVHKKIQRDKNTQKFKAILNNLPIYKEKQTKLGDFLESRPVEEQFNPKLAFRKLQGFSDKWSGQTNSSLDAVEEFLKLALEDPLEEVLIVEKERRVGSHFDQVIKLTGGFSRSAAVSANIEKIDIENTTVKWFTQLDFFQKIYLRREMVDSDDNESNLINSASPNFLLAFDLASEYSDQIEIDRNIKFIGCPLSFVWSEFRVEEKIYLRPWPMLRKHNSPSSLFKYHQDWMPMLKECKTHDGDATYKLLKSAWCKLNKIDEKEMINELSIVLDFLSDDHSQDSPTIRQQILDDYAEINFNSTLWRKLSRPREYVLAEPGDDLDYCDLVFRLRPQNVDRSQHE